MNDWWIRKYLEGSLRDLIDVLTRNFPGGIEETHENLSQDRVPGAIRTEYLLDMSLERYQYARSLGV
jgi:hypothetical protein